MLSWVTPSPANTSSCPAAVAPPWLPMGGHDEGTAAGGLHQSRQAARDFHDARNTAAADADGDLLATYLRCQPLPLPGRSQGDFRDDGLAGGQLTF